MILIQPFPMPNFLFTDGRFTASYNSNKDVSLEKFS